MFRMKMTMMLTLMLSLSGLVFAQDEPAPEYGWSSEMVGSLNLTQTSFDNWTGGGENAFAWQINFLYKFVNDQAKSNLASSGKMTYGSLKTGDQEFRKSIDEIKHESVYKYKLGWLVDPYGSFNFDTQFAPAYDYAVEPEVQISAFMDPIYFRESFGFSYQVEERFKTRLGISFKQTQSNDYGFADDAQTLTEIETTRSEVGAESVTDLSWLIAENTQLTSKLELFTAFKAFDETDVNWDTALTTKISKYFSMNFNVKLLYDKDLSAKRQLKQAMAMGLSYTFL